jgi:hypothetical protein
MVKRFIDKADTTTRGEIEKLIAGEPVEKQIRENLTYAEIDESIDNLWSILFLTGYLTRTKEPLGLEEEPVKLIIPNREVRTIFIEKIQKWFAERVKSSNRDELAALQKAFLDGNRETIEAVLNRQLRTTISYYDAHEDFYHGFLAGLLRGCGSWGVGSNRESGDGRSDILIITEDGSIGIVIEVKPARSLKDIPVMCEKAMQQIEEKNYLDAFLERGITHAKLYGIAFWKKRCGVVEKSVNIEEGWPS